MDRRLSRPAALALTLALVASFAGSMPEAAGAQEPRDGDRVTLRGTVVDAEGEPVPNITVLLETSRERFSLRRLESERGDALQVPRQTDDAGAFQFDWTWDRHYNVFSLAFGLEVMRDGKPGFEIAERRDVTGEMTGGAPPPLRHVLENAGWLRWLRLYIDGKASDDEKKIYTDLGGPETLTTDGAVTSWWYFELGKVYRLDAGRLEQVIPFEPIKPEPDADADSPS
ncbi:MAG: carboxypeptidase-like regulatory domain-containing protein [Acidobacteriota bacterium]